MYSVDESIFGDTLQPGIIEPAHRTDSSDSIFERSLGCESRTNHVDESRLSKMKTSYSSTKLYNALPVWCCNWITAIPVFR